ncbi:camp independent regulatory protein [Aspergillus clavatus NRRL 1]|uniref:Camp independent regulatory protein n=1 Tax=Aspergillus clavatus (strain ATCC 1007 / CBS 513.65 / DSM 816 / NCTC 3887 / NRRL 1 / QM 1276 / 107) TaxID=344612 RepID=A1CK61_ASPCL|nr:camp independent regulatory protein [Aspergillus clavatus NRRL 1]EAW09535.1 camp independent regulatory protein [Aspergillus clavatus NRRL 1]
METYHGHVRTPADAIILFEACRIGLLPRVQRRLSEKERQSIQSGSVFVWDEREAGMRRWTDGKSWSASRVSGSFLTYREMEGKRGGTVTQPLTSTRAGKTPDSRGSDDDRGDGTDDGPDGYRYKPDGLMKQSFSITTSTGQHLHLISYYSRSHPAAATLQQPSTDPALRHVRPQKGLYPESTVNDQQNLPVVTRGPMPGATYPVPHPMSAYVRAGTHPQSYTPPYAWPPTPLGTPPTIAIPYGGSYISAVPTPNGPAIAYGQPPPHHHHPALPPPPPQHALPHPYDRPVHPGESPLPHAIQAAAAQHTPLPVLAGRSPRLIPDGRDAHQRSPRDYPTPSIDPRIPSPRMHAPSAPHSNGMGPVNRSPRPLAQAPPTTLPQVAPPVNGTAKPAEASGSGSNGTTPTTVPSIGALMNGASGPLPSITPAPASKLNAPRLGGSPRAEGPKDIPSEKIGFGGEDMRALRQLDRVFTA